MIARRLWAALGLALILSAAPARAAQNSVVMPAAGPMSMTTFVSTYLNPGLQSLFTCSIGATAPANGIGGAPAQGQCWWDTSVGGTIVLRYYDGANWVAAGSIDTSTHAFTSLAVTGVYVGGSTGGTSTAYTLASTVPSTFSLAANVTVIATFNATNGANATLAVAGTAAKPIKRRDTGGMTTVVGGEIVAGQKLILTLDETATFWVLMTRVPGAVEQKAVDYPTVPADFNGDVYVFTASKTLTLPASSTVPNNAQISLFAEGGAVTVALASGTDTINGGSAGVSVTLASGAFSLVTTDGAGHWYMPTPSIGSGTVNSGTAGQLAWYASSTNAVSGLSNNLVTSGGDVYFGSGSPWVDIKKFGALGNGGGDDGPSIQSAVNFLESTLGAGVVYSPPGNFCVKTKVTLHNARMRLLFASTGTLWQTCGTDVNPLEVQGFATVLEHVDVAGPNILGSTNDAVHLTSGCTECQIIDGHFQQGRYAIYNEASDVYISVTRTDIALLAHIFTKGTLFLNRVELDQNFVGGTASPGTLAAPVAWTNAHVYAANAIVSITQGGKVYYVQTVAGGTSAGSVPTVLPYGQNMTDNTVTWQLLRPFPYYGLQIDTGVNDVNVNDSDFTAPFDAGIVMTNTLAGVAPASINVSKSFFGNNFTASFWGHDGGNVTITDSQMANCLLTTCAHALFSDSFLGIVTLRGNTIVQGAVGVQFGPASATDFLAEGNHVYAQNTYAFNVIAGVSKFKILNNLAGTSPIWGPNQNCVTVQPGASNNYSITGNDCTGASTGIVDGGTGRVKTVESAGAWNMVSLGLYGATSGTLTQTAPAVAGSAAIAWGTASGTPAVTASLPLAITTATGNITCATCATATLNAAALTKTDDTNVTLTLGGTPASALLNAASLTLGWTGTLGMSRGGAGGALTASNGGIVWSDASKLNVLAGTATANLPLLSGATATPAWATIAYLTSATSGGIPYFSSATQITSSGVLAVNAIMVGGGAGGAPTTASACTITSGSIFTCQSASSQLPQVTLVNSTNDANSLQFNMQKNRNGAAVTNGDSLFNFYGYGYNGSGYTTTAQFGALVAAALSTTHVPSKWVFVTSNAAAELNQTFAFDNLGHASLTLGTGATPPTTGTCGTSPAIVSGSNDNSGAITVGTGAPTSCTINFGAPWAAAPKCVVGANPQVLAFSWTVSTTAIVVTQTGTSSDVIVWHCGLGNAWLLERDLNPANDDWPVKLARAG